MRIHTKVTTNIKVQENPQPRKNPQIERKHAILRISFVQRSLRTPEAPHVVLGEFSI
jgi:hypothetical protein